MATQKKEQNVYVSVNVVFTEIQKFYFLCVKRNGSVNETLQEVVLVKKLNSEMLVMVRRGATFVLKEKFLTSYLMLESSFI